MQNINELAAQFSSLKDPFEKTNFLTKAQQQGFSLKDLAKALRVNVSYLSHFKRLKKLPEMIVDGYYANSISLSHLFVISRLSDQKQMISLYEKVLRDNLSVKQTESEVREILYHVGNEKGEYFPEEKKEAIITSLKKLLAKEINVKIIQTRIKAKVILEAKGNLKATSSFLEKLLRLLQNIK